MASEKTVVPAIEEEVAIGKTTTVEDIALRKTIEPHEGQIDQPLFRERVVIERVPKNELLEGEAPKPRMEDGVLVVPVLEEVLVFRRRVRVKEELRVRRVREQITEPGRVTLRRERVSVHRRGERQ